MRRRATPPPAPGPVTDAEVTALQRPVTHYPDWLSLDDDPPAPWRGAEARTRLEHLAMDRATDAGLRAFAAGRVTSDDMVRLRDARCGNGTWGPDGAAWLRAWHERRWPEPEGAAS